MAHGAIHHLGLDQPRMLVTPAVDSAGYPGAMP